MGKLESEVADKGGRRMGIDRRQVDIEENRGEELRSEEERRSGSDRRNGWSYEDGKSERRGSFVIK